MKVIRNYLLLVGMACFSTSSLATGDSSTNAHLKRTPQQNDVVEGQIVSISENGHVLIVPMSVFICKSLLSNVASAKSTLTKISVSDGDIGNKPCMQ